MCGRYFFDGETAKEIEDELELSPGLITTGAGDITPAMSPIVISADRVGQDFACQLCSGALRKKTKSSL